MNLFKNVHESWIPLLHSLAYEKPMVDFLENLSNKNYQPAYEQIFSVFEMPIDKIKVVLLGFEPYPMPKLSNGIAYGISENSEMPSILKAFKEEVYKTIGIGKLMPVTQESWKTLGHLTTQGVFLLNTALTVETGVGYSHLRNWEDFTNRVITYISIMQPCSWMLWGDYFKKFRKHIKNPFLVEGYDRETIKDIPADPEFNYILMGDFPTKLYMDDDRTFSRDSFYLTNAILQKNNRSKIIW